MRRAPSRAAHRRVTIPPDQRTAELEVAGRTVRLTNLAKPFWPRLGITKGDLLQYYTDVARCSFPTCATARW